MHNKKLDYLVCGWSTETDSYKKSWSNLRWDQLYNLFYQGANKILDIIETNMKAMKASGDIFKDWFMPIAKWYFSNDEVILRAMRAYLNINKKCISTKPGYQPDIYYYLAFEASGRSGPKKTIKNQLEQIVKKDDSYTYLYSSHLVQGGYSLSPLNLLLPFLENVFRGEVLPMELQ